MIKDVLHLKAPGNWINDPNGFIYYKGKYHLFYQYFPYGPQWGTMRWGHGVSEDLVHWEHVGTALFPTKAEDRNGCFSGSALEKDGRLCLYYTGVRYRQEDPENIHLCLDDQYTSTQMMITSEDGFAFDNFHGKQVIVPAITDEEIGDEKDTRDPKVRQDGDRYYMILGSTWKKRTGRVLFYESEDGQSWKYAAQLKSEKLGRILECPDLFRIEERCVFMGSPMYVSPREEGYEHNAVCMPAEFDPEACRLALSGKAQYVDWGLDLYAPQTNVDKDGRRVTIGWMRMPQAVEGVDRDSWNGMMCLPRVVELEGDHVCFRVHPEVERYFGRALLTEKRRFSGTEKPGFFGGERPLRLQTRLREGDALNIGGFRIWRENGSVMADRSRVFPEGGGHRLVSGTPGIGGECRLDIFVDSNLIEIFINEGQYVLSNIVYGLTDVLEGEVERIFGAWG